MHHNVVNDLSLMADTAENFLCRPVSAIHTKEVYSAVADISKYRSVGNAFSLQWSCVFIYRCATATLPLRNSKVTVGQQQPCRCTAVNDFVGVTTRYKLYNRCV